MTKQTGFLLSYIKYGDHDAILHCFTKEVGFQSFFVRGIYSAKNKKKAYLLAMNELVLTLSAHKNSSAIPNISNIESAKHSEIYGNIKATSVMFFVADFLHQILKNETKQDVIYGEIQQFIREVEEHNYRAHLFFLIKILKTQGLAPLLGEGVYLDPHSGNFSTIQTHHLFSKEISKIWKDLILEDIPYEPKISQEYRGVFLDSILIYYHYHFPNFKTPHSLDILTQVFE